MKKYLFILIIFYFKTASSQNLNFYTCTDGSVFKIGDTVTISDPFRGRSYYESIKIYYYKDKILNGYKALDENLSGQKFVLKSISKDTDIFYSPKIIFVLGGKGVLSKKLYLDIESAIKNGEIVLKSNMTEKLNAEVLSDKTAFSGFLKLGNFNVDNYKREYLYRFNYKLYEQVYQDEFKLNKEISSSKTDLINEINTFNSNKLFTLNSTLSFQSYDFENSGFPINEENILLNIMDRVSKHTKANFYYPKLALEFNNFPNCRFLPINADEAEKLINRRKDSYGNINRKIYCKIYFKIFSAAESTDNLDYKSLKAEIYKIDVYEFENLNGNFLGEIFPVK
jgi:hypothetical protein